MSLHHSIRAASSLRLAKNKMIPKSRVFAATRGHYKAFGMLQRSLSTNNGIDEVAKAADGPNDYGYISSVDDPRFVNGKPTLEYAKAMPTCYALMRHEQIVQLSADGVPEARAEALVRNIMTVDEVEYDDAKVVMEEIRNANRENFALHHLPHGIGLVGAIAAGAVSIPLVFHKSTVKYFNDIFVTAELPDEIDFETVLEVGSASWGWMEPVLGEASFILLSAQFARSQMKNIGIRPYTNFMRERRADKLVALYPQYDEKIVADFSRVH